MKPTVSKQNEISKIDKPDIRSTNNKRQNPNKNSQNNMLESIQKSDAEDKLKSSLKIPNNVITDKKAEKILMKSGILNAYQSLLADVCKNGLPTGNIFEYSSYFIQNYENKWKKAKIKEVKEKVSKYWEEKEKLEHSNSVDHLKGQPHKINSSHNLKTGSLSPIKKRINKESSNEKDKHSIEKVKSKKNTQKNNHDTLRSRKAEDLNQSVEVKVTKRSLSPIKSSKVTANAKDSPIKASKLGTTQKNEVLVMKKQK